MILWLLVVVVWLWVVGVVVWALRAPAVLPAPKAPKATRETQVPRGIGVSKALPAPWAPRDLLGTVLVVVSLRPR